MTNKIKGIILGGGLGTRMSPLTQEDNKHLLPVYNSRMIEYPIKTLVDAGVDEIVLVTGGKRPGAFLELLRNGEKAGLKKIYYTYQEGNKGIPDALRLAEPFVGSSPCVVLLGDNYFEDGIKHQLDKWLMDYSNTGAGCLIKKTDRPWDFGIAELNKEGKIISLEEKPLSPKSDFAVLGCYLFDESVWRILPDLKASPRGELEITSVLEEYMKQNSLISFSYNGYWSDMGTFKTWMEVSQRIAKQKEG